MARKKKNKNSQTFDVYPYLDQYQYLMRSGGSLPWYQNKSDVDIEAENKRNSTNATTSTMKGQPRPTKPDPSVSPWKEMDTETFRAAYKKWLGLNGLWEMENEGVDEREEVETETEEERLAKMSAFRKEHNIPDGQDLTEEQVSLYEKYEGPTKEEEVVDSETVTEFPIGPKEDEVIEETDVEETVVKSEYDQAVKDYQDGKISRRELDELTLRYNVAGKRTDRYKTGTTQFESLPGTPLHLLGNALQSTGKSIRQFGKKRINPKTGKPYEKADFKKTSVDWSKISNENKADILYNPEVLKQFVGGDDDLNVSDLIGSQTTVQAQHFNKFQEDRAQMDIDAGIDPLFSRQTMDRLTGDITYDDVTEDVLSKTKNPAYIEAIQLIPKDQPLDGHPDLEGIPEYLTESQTREHTDTDLTSGDLAKERLKDMSVTDYIFDKEGNVIKYKGFGSEGDGEGSTGTWEYDKDKQYGDWEETVTINKQEILNNRKKGLNDDGTEKVNIEETTEDGPKEVSRVTNADFSVTITYDDKSTKTMNEGSQERLNRLKKEKENKEEGKMGLETFVYGGQPSKEKLSFTDMYTKGGDVLKWYLDEGEVEKDEDDAVDELEEVVDANEEEVIVEEPCPDPGTCTDGQTWNPETCACEDEKAVNFTEEELEAMDETLIEDSEIVDSTYGKGRQGAKNRFGAFTKTGPIGTIGNTYGNLGQAGVDWADFGNAVLGTWDRSRREAEAENEGNLASDMFVVQESSQGIHDPLSGDAWTNKKVDEIYAGNTMKAPLIMQAGGPPAQQAPVEESLDYSALAQFEGNNAWDSEVSYSPEVIAYQKKIMGKMKNGGQLPGYQTKGEKVHDFLEYHPNYPRTFDVPYTGNFTETQLRDAITRDSTIIENDLTNSWIYRNIIGQDQTHQSNFGPAGKLQLNREWLHKLLYSDTETEADNLNFYKRGGQLPMAQEGWWDKLKTKATETWENTDFKTPINKALDYTQTTLSTAGLTPAIGIIPDAINTAISTGRTGHAAITGDMEAAKKYGTSLALNAGSMIPIAGQAFGVTSIANDAKNYASTDTPTITTPSAQIAENRNEYTKKIGQTSAKDGGEQEVEVDYEILQELIKAGADIEII